MTTSHDASMPRGDAGTPPGSRRRLSQVRSLAILERARQLLPGVTQLISRRPTRAALGFSPIYAASARGCRIRDVDGNEFIDWYSAVGPVILAVELAELLVRLVPSAEMVRYAKGGGEACTVAVRIARGVTGRDKVLLCGYHGWHDWYLAANLGAERLGSHLFNGIDPIGVPRQLEGTAMPFAYGDLEALEAQLDAHAGEVACIIMEPMRTELPPPGYLEGVRTLADRHGAILIFDEVSCGWRAHLGGVQAVTGVTPDLTVFAKAISNGYPMAAVVGRREVMEPVARMFVSSAYWDDNVGTVAALTTIRELERLDAPALFEAFGARFRAGIDAAAQASGCPARCVGIAAHPRIQFDVSAEQAGKVATLFLQENARRGVILAPGLFFNTAHVDDEAAVARTLDVVAESFGVIAEGLRRERLDELIECDLAEESFRRLVR
jgi:glutamate-1-semialdehyde 2,1-aminomutase